MEFREFSHVLAATLILATITSLDFILDLEWSLALAAVLFSIITIFTNIFSKKIMAGFLDADVEHEIWKFQRFGYKPAQKFSKPIPAGIIFPTLAIVISLIYSLGSLSFKVMTLLTYETRILKRRAAKRFGAYSYTEMTDWHNALIGGAGILGLLLISFVSYFIPLDGIELLTKITAYYAFWNLIPFSKLDGTQIFFGSKTLWTILMIFATLFTATALLIIQ